MARPSRRGVKEPCTPSAIEAALAAFDQELVQSAYHLIDLRPRETDVQYVSNVNGDRRGRVLDELTMPVRMGGFGIRLSSESAHADYFGGAAKAFQDWVHHYLPVGNEDAIVRSMANDYMATLKRVFTTLQSHCASRISSEGDTHDCATRINNAIAAMNPQSARRLPLSTSGSAGGNASHSSSGGSDRGRDSMLVKFTAASAASLLKGTFIEAIRSFTSSSPSQSTPVVIGVTRALAMLQCSSIRDRIDVDDKHGAHCRRIAANCSPVARNSMSFIPKEPVQSNLLFTSAQRMRLGIVNVAQSSIHNEGGACLFCRKQVRSNLHIFNCPAAASHVTMRHDFVKYCVASFLRESGFAVWVEPPMAYTVNPPRADLLVAMDGARGEKRQFVDIRVMCPLSASNVKYYDPLHAHERMKHKKYDGILEEMNSVHQADSYPHHTPLMFSAFVVSTHGEFGGEATTFLEECAIGAVAHTKNHSPHSNVNVKLLLTKWKRAIFRAVQMGNAGIIRAYSEYGAQWIDQQRERGLPVHDRRYTPAPIPQSSQPHTPTRIPSSSQSSALPRPHRSSLPIPISPPLPPTIHTPGFNHATIAVSVAAAASAVGGGVGGSGGVAAAVGGGSGGRE